MELPNIAQTLVLVFVFGQMFGVFRMPNIHIRPKLENPVSVNHYKSHFLFWANFVAGRKALEAVYTDNLFNATLGTFFGPIFRPIFYPTELPPRFNPVRPSYSDTRVLLEEVLEEIVKPSLLNLNETSLHMAKCVTRAYNTDYHLLVYNHFLCKCRDLMQGWVRYF